MDRRSFVTAAAGASVAHGQRRAEPVILLRSGWQTINIGDVAHTPGVLAVIERCMPGAGVILWPGSIDRGTEPMLLRRFPKLRIANGGLGPEGRPDSDQLREAFRRADLLIHGSAASISSQAQVDAWRRWTGKPYGFFGVGFTLSGEAAGAAASEQLKSIANGAAFLFTRETASLANVRTAGIKGPELGFAPDGTFSMDITDASRAEAYLRNERLETNRFICVIPRLRYTPYHKIRKVDWSEAEIQRREQANERHAESDHAKLREVIVAWVRKTGGQVLLCPEMTYQIDIIDPLLYDPLPDDVKPNVRRRRNFWLPDEASSVYMRAAAVVSCENHSPILAVTQGTPCIYVHQPEDGIKGPMWKDVGLSEWYFEVEQTTGGAIAERVLEIGANLDGARRKAREAVAYARRIQDERMSFVRHRVLARRTG